MRALEASQDSKTDKEKATEKAKEEAKERAKVRAKESAQERANEKAKIKEREKKDGLIYQVTMDSNGNTLRGDHDQDNLVQCVRFLPLSLL